MLKFRWQLGTLLLAVFALASGARVGWAHPFHISMAEMEFNSETQRLEVSLKLHASDLENVLSAMAGKRIDVEKDPLNDLVEGYLNRRFVLTTQKLVDALSKTEAVDATEGLTSKAHFVGSELETTWVWLYFELELPQAMLDSSSNLYFVNAVLMERIKDQINTATVRVGTRRHAIKTTLKSPFQEFSVLWLKPQQVSSEPPAP